MDSKLLEKIEKSYIKKAPELRAGDTVRVHQKIKEGAKERVQVFEGVVLRVSGGGLRQSFLVRKISFGIGVERNFLVHSPNIAKIEVKKRSGVRRAYLTYLRSLTGKKARLKDKDFDALIVNVKEEPVEEVKKGDPSTVAQDDAKTSEEARDASNSASDEAAQDKEVTELSAEEVADSNVEEVPLSEVEKAEEKEIEAEDKKGEDAPDEGGQAAEKAETEEGEQRAEKDAGKEKVKEDKRVEKTAEAKEPDLS